MYITAYSLDDLLYRVYSKLLGEEKLAPQKRLRGTRGELFEMTGVLLSLRNPRARLSRTAGRGRVFSGLGELLWYLSGTNSTDFITYYLQKYTKEDENGKIWGGYGPRLLDFDGVNQLTNVIKLLNHKPDSKRAVIQIFDANDIIGELDEKTRHKDVPCTCILQFMIRRSKLNLITYMRSNDAVIGLPHDIFAFTMIQEIVARSLGVEIGVYRHCVGSLHLYATEESLKKARELINDGWQQTVAMPPMPFGHQDDSLKVVLELESRIRKNQVVTGKMIARLDPYWADIVRLLQIHRLIKDKNISAIQKIKDKMHSPVFNTYIKRKQKIKSAVLSQKELPFNGVE